jgi:hypothetical protein
VNLKPFVNNKELWTDFQQELGNRIQASYKKLEQVTDTVDIYRTQGEIQALKNLMKLRDKVNAE